jgi:hypothetical protein
LVVAVAEHIIQVQAVMAEQVALAHIALPVQDTEQTDIINTTVDYRALAQAAT